MKSLYEESKSRSQVRTQKGSGSTQEQGGDKRLDTKGRKDELMSEGMEIEEEKEAGTFS